MSSFDKSLYLVQSDYDRTPAILNRIGDFYADTDAIVLMGDAVLHYMDTRLMNKAHVYLLERELDLLPDHPTHIQILDPAAFADLILRYHRCITFK